MDLNILPGPEGCSNRNG